MTMKTGISMLSICILLVAFKIIITPYQLGITPDSVKYIETAQKILMGRDFPRCLLHNHWPPIYPLLLSLMSYISGINIIDVSIYLNMGLLLILWFLYAKILFALEFHTIIILVLPILLFVSVPMTISLKLWSELPFVLVLMSMIYSFVQWHKTEQYQMLVIAGLWSILLILTRYAGAGFIGSFSVMILWSKKVNYVRRVSALVGYLSPIAMGIIIWFLVIKMNNGSLSDRDFEFHPIGVDKLQQSMLSMASWFMKDIFSLVIFSCFWIGVGYFILTNKSGFMEYYSKKHALIISFIIFGVGYYGFLIFSVSFFDAHTQMNNRILMPIFPVVLLVLGFIIDFVLKNHQGFTRHILVIILCFSVLYSSGSIWMSHYQNGYDFTHKRHHNDELFIKDVLFKTPEVIYTNACDLVDYYSNFSVQTKYLPYRILPTSKKYNKDYKAEKTRMFNLIKLGRGQLVYFDSIKRPYLMSKEEILKKLDDIPRRYFNGGVHIYLDK